MRPGRRRCVWPDLPAAQPERDARRAAQPLHGHPRHHRRASWWSSRSCRGAFVQLFWIVALGMLFLNRWPNGRGPAWSVVEAIPWPTAADAQAARQARRRPRRSWKRRSRSRRRGREPRERPVSRKKQAPRRTLSSARPPARERDGSRSPSTGSGSASTAASQVRRVGVVRGRPHGRQRQRRPRGPAPSATAARGCRPAPAAGPSVSPQPLLLVGVHRQQPQRRRQLGQVAGSTPWPPRACRRGAARARSPRPRAGRTPPARRPRRRRAAAAGPRRRPPPRSTRGWARAARRAA